MVMKYQNITIIERLGIKWVRCHRGKNWFKNDVGK